MNDSFNPKCYLVINNIPKQFNFLELNLTVASATLAGLLDKEITSNNYTSKHIKPLTNEVFIGIIQSLKIGKHLIIFEDYEVFYQIDEDNDKSLIIVRKRYRNKVYLYYHNNITKIIKRATTQDGVIRSLCNNDILNATFLRVTNLDFTTKRHF